MGKFFNSRFFEGISKAVDVVLIGFYFLICSIPVFTIGASVTGMYYACHKSVFKGRGYTTEFFHSFKENFKQSTLSWLIFLLIFLLLGGDIYITRHVVSTSTVIEVAPVFFSVLFAVAVLWSIYHFAYIARFANGFKDSFKVSAVFMIVNFGWSLLILLIIILTILIIARMPILFVFLPGVFTCAIHPIIEHVFRKYMSEEDLAREDE